MAYAEKRCIEVIPEIEFPAHSDEVFVGYPELCCMGKPYAGGEFCAGNEQTYTFMEDVDGSYRPFSLRLMFILAVMKPAK